MIVFTLPTCTNCPAVKRISGELAQRYRLRCREVGISTSEGQLDGLMHQIMRTPSIALDNDVIAWGSPLSREELETKIRKRLSR